MSIKELRKEIRQRERTISLLGYDVIGSSAGSNVDRMNELRAEIQNLKAYGHPRPNWWYRIFNGYSKGINQ